MLIWRGDTYHGTGELTAPPPRGRELGVGVVPGCNDTPGAESAPDRDVRLVAIEGVTARVAVYVDDEPFAYVAGGYLVESPRHPLHDAIFGSAARPDEHAGFRCGEPRLLRARVEAAPALGRVFRVEGMNAEAESLLERYDDGAVFVDAATAVSGFDREGIPFVEEGVELSLTLRECKGSGGARKLVVERLER